MNSPQQFRFYLNQRYGPNCLGIFRKLEKLYIKLSHSENSITFLYKCKNNNLIPKCLKLHTSYSNHKTQKILDRASRALLRERIQFHRYNKINLNNEIQNLKTTLLQQINRGDFDYICFCINNSYLINFQKQKQIHINKLNVLFRENAKKELKDIDNGQFVNKTVINLSDKILSEPENLFFLKLLTIQLLRNFHLN